MTRDELIEAMARAVWDTRGYVHSSEARMFEPLTYGEEGEYAPAQAICQDAAKSALCALCAALPGLSDVLDGKAMILPITGIFTAEQLERGKKELEKLRGGVARNQAAMIETRPK